MTEPASPFAAARAFIAGHARILDQRRAEAIFDGGPTEPVVAAVLAYRNADGGFGHGLEPDTRCPDSQPLYAQVGLEAVASVRARLPTDVTTSLCDHLASVSGPGGAVPIMVPSFARYPRASHWQGAESFPPDLNPTAAIVGLLRGMEVDHLWLDEATEWCVSTLESDGPPTEAHALACVLGLLESMPGDSRTEAIAAQAQAALDDVSYYRVDPDDPTYGLTPLDLAPSPDSPWRSWFDDDLVDAHLDRLAAEQQPDGGWPIRWEPPTDAAVLEWRGMVTLHALVTLDSYGRSPGPRGR